MNWLCLRGRWDLIFEVRAQVCSSTIDPSRRSTGDGDEHVKVLCGSARPLQTYGPWGACSPMRSRTSRSCFCASFTWTMRMQGRPPILEPVYDEMFRVLVCETYLNGWGADRSHPDMLRRIGQSLGNREGRSAMAASTVPEKMAGYDQTGDGARMKTAQRVVVATLRPGLWLSAKSGNRRRQRDRDRLSASTVQCSSLRCPPRSTIVVGYRTAIGRKHVHRNAVCG